MVWWELFRDQLKNGKTVARAERIADNAEQAAIKRLTVPGVEHSPAVFDNPPAVKIDVSAEVYGKIRQGQFKKAVFKNDKTGEIRTAQLVFSKEVGGN